MSHSLIESAPVVAQLDWLRLSCWDWQLYPELLAALMPKVAGRWELGQWLQYKGQKSGGYFVGQAEQNGKRHVVANASGPNALSLYHASTPFADKHGIYCTRLDIQRTIPRPQYGSLRGVRDAMTKTNTTLIESRDNDTLYVGSRESAIFTRLYEKNLDARYLRLEFELKADRSKAAYRALLAGEPLDAIYFHYLEKSHFPDEVKQWFSGAGDYASEAVLRAETERQDQNTLNWLYGLNNAVRQAAANHSIGANVRSLIAEWHKYALHLDSEDGRD
jgi:hypothetical protein